MKCPIDENVLQMTDRQGIEIDYCPQCRGVWLDRGELDKLIERSTTATPAAATPTAATPAAPAQAPPAGSSYDSGRTSHPQQKYDDRGRDGAPHKRRKKESFLGELFDF